MRPDVNSLAVWTAVLFFMAGCAKPLAEKQGLVFPYATVEIHGQHYFALVRMCEEQGWRWDYDPLSKIILLEKDGHRIRVLVGSSRVLVDGRVRILSADVILREGVIYVPLDFQSLGLGGPREGSGG